MQINFLVKENISQERIKVIICKNIEQILVNYDSRMTDLTGEPVIITDITEK